MPIIKNKITILLLITFIVSLFTFDYTKRTISRLIFSHELSLLTNTVFKIIDDKQDFDMYLEDNKKKSLIVLNEYVTDLHQELFTNLDDGVSWKMLHGSIYCDGVTDIFLRLAENTNTRVVMAFLHMDNGRSPHTIPFADIDNSLKNDLKMGVIYNNLEMNEMYVFDPSNGYIPLNKNNKFVNVNQMIKNKNEYIDYKMLHEINPEDDTDIKPLRLLINKKQVHIVNDKKNEKSILSKISGKIVKILPKKILFYLFKFAIFIHPNPQEKVVASNNDSIEVVFTSDRVLNKNWKVPTNEEYKKLLYARLDHIFFNYDDAVKKYSQIKKDSFYYEDAQLWIDMINSKNNEIKFENLLNPLTNSNISKNFKT